MCDYISEILDAGLLGPLFMVMVEHHPNEVFIHMSATRLWDMVRERVNLEITKQHKMGRINLPCLQPHESVDGLEMFGLSSPAVMQVIEALDPSLVCTEYWRSGQAPSLQATLIKDNGSSLIKDPKAMKMGLCLFAPMWPLGLVAFSRRPTQRSCMLCKAYRAVMRPTTLSIKSSSF